MDGPVAARLKALPPYLFDAIDKKKQAAIDRGVDVIDLGVGDPDLPTPDHIVDALAEAAKDPTNHPYPPYRGTKQLRESVARYMDRRFGVKVDPDREVIALIGSKEGIGHLPVGLVDPGRVVLVPDPSYPVYSSSASFVGGEVVKMPLRREDGFLPRLGEVAEEHASRAALMWLNYPNNPTGATCTLDFFAEVGRFAETHDICVAHDCAYAEIYTGGPAPPSALQVDALRPRCIEFHSLSKTFNMTGWRVGFAVGAEWAVQALAKVKTNMDSGTFGAVQAAACAALDGPWDCVEGLKERYRKRRDLILPGLRKAGYDCLDTRATFFQLVGAPGGRGSLAFTEEVLDKAGIVCTPCIGFGEGGDGLVRFSLTAPDERIEEAGKRLASLA